MNTLQTITGGLVSNLLPAVTMALLLVLGGLMSLIYAFWGALKLYAHISGKSSGWVSYKVGRVFGDLVYEDGYRKYKSGRDKAALTASYRARYNNSKP